MEILGFKITVQNEEALGQVTAELQKLSKERAALNKKAKTAEGLNQQEVKTLGELGNKTKQLQTAKRLLTNGANAQANTIREVNSQLAIEKERIKGLVIGSKEFNAVGARIKNLENKQRAFNAQLGRGTTFVGEYSKGFKQAFTQIGLAVGGALLVFNKLQRIVGGSLEKFAIQQEAVNDAKNVFGAYADTIIRAAGETQKLSKVGDEAYIKLAVQAKNFGLETVKVNDAVRGSIGLAEKFKTAGLSQETALKGIANAYAGNFSQLERYIPSLRTAETETEKMTILTNEMASGFEFAAEQTETLAGKQAQLSNAYGDLQENFGGFIAQLIDELLPNLTNELTDLNTFLADESIPAWEKFAALFSPSGTVTKSLDDYNKKFAQVLIDNGKEIEVLQKLNERVQNGDADAATALIELTQKITEIRKESNEAERLEYAQTTQSFIDNLNKRYEALTADAEKKKEAQEATDEAERERQATKSENEANQIKKLSTRTVEIKKNETQELAPLGKTQKQINNEYLNQLSEREQAEAQLANARITLANSVLSAVQSVTDKESSLYKASLAAQKIFALAQVGIELQKELALINANPAVNADITQTTRVALITNAIARGIGIAASIAAIKFAGGGIIDPGNELPGFSKNTDNTLILAKPGEVILNEQQQAALGGPGTFRAIGVPGFANGGQVPPSVSPPSSAAAIAAAGGMSREEVAQMIVTGLNSQRVIQVESDVTGIQTRVNQSETENIF